MAVFKRKRDGKADSGWTIQIVDHQEIKRRLAGFKSRAASEELERAILRLVSLRQVNAAFSPEDNRFIESAPSQVREKLAEWGVISGERAAAGKVISRHIADWRVELEARGNTRRHVKNFTAKVTALAKACKWRYLTDIALQGAQNWLSSRRDANMSAATCNAYIRAAKGFCGWLMKEKRMSENPLAFWSLLNEKTDRRYERHAFTVEELGKLLAAAEDGPTHHGMTGADRALLYRAAVETGFRWSELHSLTRASFDFSASPATVTIEAAYAKNGKEDVISLRPELADDLKARMSMFLPAAKAFPGMWRGRGADMIRADLEATNVLSRDADDNLVTVDEYGLSYDFHSLRHTFGTLLNKAKVPLATAQKLMRHSDPKLTANTYTHVLLDDKAEALAKLPTIAPMRPDNQNATKTGTDDAIIMQTGHPVKVDVSVTGEMGGGAAEIRDTRRDTYAAAFDGRIRTYTNSSLARNQTGETVSETKNALSHKGQQGVKSGANYRIRTDDLCFTKALLYH